MGFWFGARYGSMIGSADLLGVCSGVRLIGLGSIMIQNSTDCIDRRGTL